MNIDKIRHDIQFLTLGLYVERKRSSLTAECSHASDVFFFFFLQVFYFRTIIH